MHLADALLPRSRIDDGKSRSEVDPVAATVAVTSTSSTPPSTPTLSPPPPSPPPPPAGSRPRRRLSPSARSRARGPRGLLPLPGRRRHPRGRSGPAPAPLSFLQRRGARLAPPRPLHRRGLRGEGPSAPRRPAEEGGPALGPRGRLQEPEGSQRLVSGLGPEPEPEQRRASRAASAARRRRAGLEPRARVQSAQGLPGPLRAALLPAVPEDSGSGEGRRRGRLREGLRFIAGRPRVGRSGS